MFAAGKTCSCLLNSCLHVCDKMKEKYKTETYTDMVVTEPCGDKTLKYYQNTNHKPC